MILNQIITQFPQELGLNQEMALIEYSGFKWEELKLRKKNFLVRLSGKDQRQYIYDGEIIRTEQYDYFSNKTDIMTNIQEIQNLYWNGLKQNAQKVGKWTISWDGETIDAGGYYGYPQNI